MEKALHKKKNCKKKKPREKRMKDVKNIFVTVKKKKTIHTRAFSYC